MEASNIKRARLQKPAENFIYLWVFSPAISFALFLLGSAFHFSHSEADIKTLGVSAILGSLAVYPNETVRYFAMLTGNNIFLAPSQTILICVGTIALILPILEGLYKGKEGLRIIAWIGVACFLPPVEAVALYFFFFHALAEYLKVASNKNQLIGRFGSLERQICPKNPVILL